jgi:hypothetical protein
MEPDFATARKRRIMPGHRWKNFAKSQPLRVEFDVIYLTKDKDGNVREGEWDPLFAVFYIPKKKPA